MAIGLAARLLAPTPAVAKPPPPAAAPAAPTEVERLTREMNENFHAGRYAEAVPQAERILALHEKKLGADHPTTADAAADLGTLYHKLDDGRAEGLVLRAVTALEKAHGADHPDVLLRVLDLGNLYKDRHDLTRAEPLLLRVVAGYEKAFGAEHLRVAEALYYLAQAYKSGGDFARAEPLYLRSLAIREKIAGPDSIEAAKSLNDIANIYSDRGDFARAEPLHLRALGIVEKKLGPEHAQLASFLHSLALTYKLAGELGKAEALYLRALAIREKSVGPNSGSLTATLQNLGSVYKAKGDYVRAEPFYQRALSIAEKVHGPDSPTTAIVLSSVGLFYRARRDYVRAEQLYLRALSIRERVRGPEHVDVGDSANNLGLLYAVIGDGPKAEPLLRRALSIYEKKLGPEHPKVATALTNVAGLERDLGHFALSRSLYLRSLAITEKIEGKGHLSAATTLNNLSTVHLAEGHFAEAEAALARALAIYEAVFGKDHPEIGTALSNLAATRMFQGDARGALPALARSTDMLDRHAALILGSGSEEQKRVFMLALQPQTFQTVELQRLAEGDAEAMRLALRTILRRKGRVLDAMADSIAALRRRLDDGDRQALDELGSVQSSLARLLVGGAAGKGPDARAEIAALEEKRQALEARISRRSAAFQAETPLVTVEQVEAALPEGAALIETFAHRPPAADAQKSGGFGPARYGAYVLRKGAPLRFVDLGESAIIDGEVEELRRALSNSSRDPKVLARKLDARIMAPVRALLGGARTIYLSPDGALNLLPFGALVDESGHYLLESHHLTYVSSGRDLLRRGEPSSASGPPLIVANPDFGKKAAGGDRARDRGALRGISFPPLPGTAEEARAIGRALGAQVLEGPAATEEAMKALHRPRILHLATHGFFLPVRQTVELTEKTRGLVLDEEAADPGPGAESPLLRSGLALASINAPEASGEDGVLTALETAGLDLFGTRLVVLSACETALGEARGGEGVYGLRRALVLAGAETQVMSLWKVDDGATRDLMVAYYKGLLAGGGRSEALRVVALEMLASKGRAHPFYWASFIVSGSDAPLEPPGGSGAPAKVEPGPRGCSCALPGSEGDPAGGSSAFFFGLAVALAALRERFARYWTLRLTTGDQAVRPERVIAWTRKKWSACGRTSPR